MTPISLPLDQAEALRAMYPERDGKPMSDNMTQARWIYLLYSNLRALFADRDDVLVAADNLWYPDKDQRDERQAPDVYVVFGRPKDDRSSYMQWLENDIPLTVVFEILSPGNSDEEMTKKFDFYDHYRVEEYYIYDPVRNRLQIYTRGLKTFRHHPDIDRFVSPNLGIRFEMTQPEMTVFGPNGKPFLTPEESHWEHQRQQQRADEEKQRADEEKQRSQMAEQRANEEKQRANEEKQRADEEKQRADEEKQRADEEKQRAELAEQRANEEKQRADEEKQRTNEEKRSRSRMVELSRRARQGLATADEVAELDRLEEASS